MPRSLCDQYTCTMLKTLNTQSHENANWEISPSEQKVGCPLLKNFNHLCHGDVEKSKRHASSQEGIFIVKCAFYVTDKMSQMFYNSCSQSHCAALEDQIKTSIWLHFDFN